MKWKYYRHMEATYHTKFIGRKPTEVQMHMGHPQCLVSSGSSHPYRLEPPFQIRSCHTLPVCMLPHHKAGYLLHHNVYACILVLTVPVSAPNILLWFFLEGYMKKSSRMGVSWTENHWDSENKKKLPLQHLVAVRLKCTEAATVCNIDTVGYSSKDIFCRKA